MIEPRVLIIEDDPDGRESVKLAVEDCGCDVVVAENGTEGLARLTEGSFDVILSDLIMPELDGLEVLSEVKNRKIDSPFIMMTAYGTVSTAVQALKSGAYDYITKPLDLDDLQSKVLKAAEVSCLRSQVADLKESVKSRFSASSIVTQDEEMLSVINDVRTLADADATVLVQGESGTGKELVARALHVDGKRSSGPFVAVNCGAFTDSLLESELFGHEKGAFTGATSRRKGAFERAQGGTLFLDEIGNAPSSVQIKLLRVLEEKEFMRVGGEQVIKADVRVVSAANRMLEDLVAEGDFREDLLYRLKVITVSIPPLRERDGDVRLLTEHFVAEIAREQGKVVSGVDDEVYKLLESYKWPGNVRELRNIIESSVIMMSGSVLSEGDIRLQERAEESPEAFVVPDGMNMQGIEKEVLSQLLSRNRGNKTIVADLLGISRRTIQRKIQEFDLPY